jgi:hypothetical protein
MGFELEWVKENKCERALNFNNFFSTLFNFYTKFLSSHKLIKPKPSREKCAVFATGKVEIDGAFFNQPTISKTVLVQISSLIQRMSKDLKEGKSGKCIFSSVGKYKNQVGVFLAFSLSFFKPTYSPNWKNAFFQLFKKSNSLVRWDTNSAVSSLKFLQTTII